MANAPGAHRIDPDLAPEEFHLFRDYIHRHSGIYLEDDKLDSLRISLLARATFLGCPDYQGYYQILSTNEREFVELMGLITINETSFLRFPQQFDVLRKKVVPEILARAGDDPPAVRVWSAGCSTGEEPYSIAMTIDDALSGSPDGIRVQILGTDVSQKALATARHATYGRRTMLNVPPEILRRYFEVTGERYRVKRRIRDMVDFGYHNLIKEPYPLSLIGTWDVIFCRNVTIYFKLESTKRVVANFYRSLVDGGYLFIGHSETLHGVSDEFAPVELQGVFLYKKEPPAPRARTFDFLATRPKIDASPPARRDVPRQEKAPPDWRPVPRPAPSAASAASDMLKAGALVKEGDFAEALPIIQSVLDADPNNAKAHLLRGFVHAEQGGYDDAIGECQKAIAIDPLLASARYVLGVIHQQRGELTEAVSELRRTVYSDADFALAHFQLATILKGQGDKAGARKAFRATLAAIQAQPKGDWTEFLGGFDPEVLTRTCERGLKELAQT